MKRDEQTLVLPDVAASGNAGSPLPLEWVGMQGIALPLWLAEGGRRSRSTPGRTCTWTCPTRE